MSDRLLYNQAEAAKVLGMSVGTFVRHVRPHLRRVEIDGRPRYPRGELERWVDRRARGL